mgnify:CR=1 FL=1
MQKKKGVDDMRIATHLEQTRDIIRYWKKQDLTIGLVTTMGKIKEGHIDLIKRAIHENDRVVVSAFVNPLQFPSLEECNAYPVDDNETDAVCEELGVDLIFRPVREEMYSGRYCTFVTCEEWSEKLTASDQFDYYRGFSTIVVKMFHIIQPDSIYIRNKSTRDAELFKLLAQDLNMDVQIYTQDLR